MAYLFSETVTLEVPQIGPSFSGFQESETGTKGLIVELAAIHEGQTSNFNYYSATELEGALDSWVNPYPKPVLKNHDLNAEPLGRVMAAKMDKEEDGTPFVRLQVAITDSEAVEKVLDQRYLTGSVGGKAEEALCSICNSDWSKASALRPGCKHARGRTYKVNDQEHRAHIKMGKISFKEYSIVNSPADNRSGIRSAAKPESNALENENEWVRPARFFALSMNKEEIFELTESEDRNVLSGMKKKDASSLYMGIKGAFLSSLAVHESEEENSVADEDILAVSEGLSDDLTEAANTEETPQDTVPEAPEKKPHAFRKGNTASECAVCGCEESNNLHNVKDQNDDPDLIKDDGTNAKDRATDEETQEEESVEEGSVNDNRPFSTEDPSFNRPKSVRPQGQEKSHAHDVNPETSGGAPINREGEEEVPEINEQTVSAEEMFSELEQKNTELNEHIKALESRVEEFETRETTLSEENARLKAALKRSLVERIVDNKIALGFIQKEEREDQINEHMARTATSLADTLRDFATVTPSKDYSGFPTINTNSMAIPAEGKHSGGSKDNGTQEKVFTINPIEQDTRKSVNAEDFFVDALMGRKQL